MHRTVPVWSVKIRVPTRPVVPWCTNGNAVGTGGEIFGMRAILDVGVVSVTVLMMGAVGMEPEARHLRDVALATSSRSWGDHAGRSFVLGTRQEHAVNVSGGMTRWSNQGGEGTQYRRAQ